MEIAFVLETFEAEGHVVIVWEMGWSGRAVPHSLRNDVMNGAPGVSFDTEESEMAQCGVIGCAKWVSGGFQAVVEAGTFESPFATTPTMRTLWCEDHESLLNKGLGNGDYLTEDEVRAL